METKRADPKETVALSTNERRKLEKILHSTSNAAVYRHAEAILAIDSGESQNATASRLHVSRQTIYAWVHEFRNRDEECLEARLANRKRSGRPRTVSGIIDPWILGIIDTDPRKLGFAATTWTAKLLAEYIHDKHGFKVSYHSTRLALDRLGFRWKRPRYTLSRRSPNWRRKKGA